MNKKDFISGFPVSFFAVVMGMAGFAMSLKEAESHGLGLILSPYFAGAALGIFGIIALIYIIKAVFFTGEVKSEYHNNTKVGFFVMIPISLILTGGVLGKAAPEFAQGLWQIGALGQLFLTVMLINRWIYDTRVDISMLTPAWFIPAVGNMLVAATGSEYASLTFNMFFLSTGFLFWALLFIFLLFRMFFHKPHAADVTRTMFAMLAPPAVGFIGITNFYPQEIGLLAYFLYFSALFLFILLFSRILGFLMTKPSLAWWSYIFSLAMLTVATFRMQNIITPQADFLNIFAWFLSGLLAFFFIYLTIITAYLLAARKL